MAKILFLDDMEERHSAFIRATVGRGHSVDQVWGASDAIKRLELQKYDQVFLDHDLSEDDIMVRVGAPSKVRTGMDVVDHILSMDNPPPDVIVHSCNGPAREEMRRRLAGHPAGIRVRAIPFPDLIRGIYAANV